VFVLVTVIVMIWPTVGGWLLIIAVPAYVIRCLWKALAEMERLLP